MRAMVGVEAADRRTNRLILSTIPSAKGLEWHLGLRHLGADGKFPSLYSFAANEDLEEERRLFYVAITRAKQNLYLPVRSMSSIGPPAWCCQSRLGF